MNEYWVGAIFIVCATALVVLTLGEPDLLDAFVHRLMQ